MGKNVSTAVAHLGERCTQEVRKAQKAVVYILERLANENSHGLNIA
jgi:hypothetical protein